MINITAIIVAKNNPPHFLQSVQSIENFASEIIIGNIHIDKDLLLKLKPNKKVIIVELPDSIAYADLIKEKLKKLAKYEYILYLDPDEIFPREAIKVIDKKIDQFDYFYFPRKNIIFGKWIEHSRWWPDYQLRFFKKDYVIWPKKLHPEPKAKGVGFTFYPEVRYAILHYNYRNIDEYLEKAIRYAKSEASMYIEKKINLTLSETLKKALGEFISRFFACDGYKDGMHGLTLAIFQMFYYFLVYTYYWERKKYFIVEKNTLLDGIKQFFISAANEINYWMTYKKLISLKDKYRIKIFNKILSVIGK